MADEVYSKKAIAFVMAAGKGSRFVDGQLSKHMQMVHGESLIQHHIKSIKASGIDKIVLACPKNERGLELVKHLDILAHHNNYNIFYGKELYAIIDDCQKFEFIEKVLDKKICRLNQGGYSMVASDNPKGAPPVNVMHKQFRGYQKTNLIDSLDQNGLEYSSYGKKYKWMTEKNPLSGKKDIFIFNADSVYGSPIIRKAIEYSREYMAPDDAGLIVLLKPFEHTPQKNYGLVVDEFSNLDGMIRYVNGDKLDMEHAMLKDITSSNTKTTHEPAFYMVRTSALEELNDYRLGTTEFFKEMTEQNKKVHVLKIDSSYFNINDVRSYSAMVDFLSKRSQLYDFLIKDKGRGR
jgi:hypothetical protein